MINGYYSELMRRVYHTLFLRTAEVGRGYIILY